MVAARPTAARLSPWQTWLKLARIAHGSLFRFVTGQGKAVGVERLNDQEVARLVKRAALAAGERGGLSRGERGQRFFLAIRCARPRPRSRALCAKSSCHASAEMTRKYQRRRDWFRVLTMASGFVGCGTPIAAGDSGCGNAPENHIPNHKVDECPGSLGAVHPSNLRPVPSWELKVRVVSARRRVMREVCILDASSGSFANRWSRPRGRPPGDRCSLLLASSTTHWRGERVDRTPTCQTVADCCQLAWAA